MKNLLIFSNDKIEDYIKKGTIHDRIKYFNPQLLFDQVFIVHSGHINYIIKYKNKKIIFKGTRFAYPFNLIINLFKGIYLIKKYPILVIRSYNPLLEGLVVISLGKLFSMPTVISVHSDYNLLFIVRRIPLLLKGLFHIIQKIVYSQSTRIFVVSSGLYDYVASLGANNEKINIIFNRVNVSLFSFTKNLKLKGRDILHISEDDFVIIYTGRICIEKDLRPSVKAIAQLKNDGYNIKFIIVGDEISSPFSTSIKNDLVNKITNLKMNDDIIITGFIPHYLLPMYYAAGDVFLFPSYLYGFGISLAEAISMSMPTICSKILWIRDKGDLATPTNSILVDPSKSTEIAKAIITLMKSESLRVAMGKKGREKALKYSSSIIEKNESKKYISLMSDVNIEN